MQHISTENAMKIVGMSANLWRLALDGGFLHPSSVPPLARGRRSWEADHLMVVAWYQSLCTAGMKRPMAGGLANELAKALKRDPLAASFNCYVWEDPTTSTGHLAIGQAPPDDAPADVRIIMTVPVEDLRQRIRAGVADFLQRREAERARK